MNKAADKGEHHHMIKTGTYGFYEGKLYRLSQRVDGSNQEWHPVKNIGQIAPTARICDE